MAVLRIAQPNLELPPFITNITFIVEQSFSDFGDADLVILFQDGKGRGYTTFIEAKVACGARWALENRALSVFHQKQNPHPVADQQSIKKRCDNSDLLTQLFFKKLMVDVISNKKNWCKRTPGFGSKENQSLGKNKIVQAAKEMVSDHLEKAFYIGLIPSDPVAVHSPRIGITMADEFLKQVSFISWKQLDEYCQSPENSGEFPLTIAAFSYNGDQIYKKPIH